MSTKLTQTFESFLREKFAETYGGAADDAAEAFEDWFERFDDAAWLAWGERFAASEVEAALTPTQ